MAKLFRLILPLAILAIGYFGYQRLAVEEEPELPPMKKRELTETKAQLIQREDFQVTLQSQGIVRPHNQTRLSSQVGGRIVRISPVFESGSFFELGTILLELDSSDFEAAVVSAEASLARAEANLAQESARAEQAKLDWKDLGYTDEPTDLVLRKPQLKEARANVKAAQAQLLDAERDLSRTIIKAPYAGRVRERLVGLGQSINTGTALGEIFSTDFAEVRLSLSARELSYIELPNNPGDDPVPVVLLDALEDDSETTWEGAIVRTEGSLDERSRKLFVIARVDDPFGLKNNALPPLRIGQPVRAAMVGKTIPNVFVVPRAALRRPNEVTMIHPEEFTLKRQKIAPVWSDAEHLIVPEGLNEGWHLVMSKIRNLPNGAKVTIIEDEDVEEETEAPALGANGSSIPHS